MKQINFLVVLLFFLATQQGKSQTYFHQLYNVGTTLSQATSNHCSNANIGRLKINITNKRLVTGKIYYFEGDGDLAYYKVISSRFGSNQDADDTINGNDIGNPVTITCSIDSDNDGIEDSQDQCPNQAGPPSNNGCPGNPELSIVLNGSSILSDCFSCNIFFNTLGTDRHFVNFGGIANLDVLVQNTGNVASSSTNVAIYVSADNTYQSNADTLVKSFSLGSINPNNTRYSSGALFYSDLDPFGGNFWLIVRVDDSENNSETNENNNTFAIRFRRN